MKINKKLLLIIILVVPILVFLILKSQSPTFVPGPDTIVGPDAPLNSDVSQNDFLNSGNNPVSSPTGPINIDDSSEVQISPDENNILIQKEAPPSEDDSTSLINLIIPKVEAITFSKTYSLTVTDKTGKHLKLIEPNDVVTSKFADNNFVTYELAGIDAGIYRYDIQNDVRDLVQVTSNPESFKYTAFINSNKYFYIQPTSGKIGFGNMEDDTLIEIGQKVLPTNGNYSSVSAYSFPTVSPAGNYISFFDSTGPTGLTLIVIKSDAIDLNNKVLEIPITTLSYQGGKDSPVLWSADSSTITLGYNGMIIDVNTKAVTYDAKASTYGIKISPDKTLLFANLSGAPVIQSFDNTQKYDLPKNISDFAWLNSNKALFVIGNNLYIYTLSTKTLTKGLAANAVYTIMSSDGVGNAVVKQGNLIIKISVK